MITHRKQRPVITTSLCSKREESKMEFVASYWWLWLVAVVFFGGMVFHIQLKNIKNMNFSRIGAVIGLALIAWVAGIMFALSIVINLINYAKR
jgi:hypothetical protein